jgi:TonB family protein
VRPANAPAWRRFSDCTTLEIRGGTVLADTRANRQSNTMRDVWKQWEGQVADGRFRLRQYLGGTERGPVFLCESGGPEPHKEAIKLVLADAQNAEAQLARWAQASSLSHPHLLKMFGTGRCEVGGARMAYAVMEFADEDLGQVVPVRALTPIETREMLRPLLETLAYLHAKGLVHGHIRPSNIMAVGEELKISSDGISAPRETAIGRREATVHDAPESGTRGGSAAGDVWSLGVTLVEVLTQKLPAWEWKGQEEPELPRLPAPFGDIARQCLRRDPQQRCTLTEIAARLDPDAPPLGKPQVAVTKAAPVAAVATSAPAPGVRYAPAAKPSVAEAGPRTESVAKKRSGRLALQGAAIVVVLGVVAFAVARISSRGSAADTGNAPGAAASAPTLKPEASEAKPAAENPSRTNDSADRTGASASAATPATAPVSAPVPKPLAKKATFAGVGGGVEHQVMPSVPRFASATIRGTVRVGVRVHVDQSGKVVGADLESAGPSRYFANLAEKAARDWTFVPPMADGQAVSSEWLLRFEFMQDGTKAAATPASR